MGVYMPVHKPGYWHIGAMNDTVFIIDRPPRPPADTVLPEPPDLEIIAGPLTVETAESICIVHNDVVDQLGTRVQGVGNMQHKELVDACASIEKQLGPFNATGIKFAIPQADFDSLYPGCTAVQIGKVNVVPNATS